MTATRPFTNVEKRKEQRMAAKKDPILNIEVIYDNEGFYGFKFRCKIALPSRIVEEKKVAADDASSTQLRLFDLEALG